MKKLYLLPLLSVSLFFAASVTAHAQDANSPYQQISIRLRGVDGKNYDIDSLRGNVVLISFGATWCLPCKEELKALEDLKREYRDKPVKFLWISIDHNDQVSDGGLRDYAKKLKISFPVLRDPETTTFSRFSPRRRLPTILFLDKLGRLSLPNHVGMSAIPLYMSTMRARLDRLLANKSATVSSGR